jgi:N-methylhydantoinase A
LSDVGVTRICDELIAFARADLDAEGVEDAEMTVSLDLRYAGQWHEIEVRATATPDLERAARDFEDAHERQWGHRRREDAIELTGVRLRALSSIPKPRVKALATAETASKGSRQATFFAAGEVSAEVYDRARLGKSRLLGPLIVEEDQTTTVVPPGVAVEPGEQGDLVLSR